MKARKLTISLILILFLSSLCFSQIIFEDHPDNPVLSGTEGAWDAYAIISTSVVHDGEKFYMYFTATDKAWSREDFNPMDVGYATSVDGIEWLKYPFNPIFKYDREGWESGGIYEPIVVKTDSLWYMWYTIQIDVDLDYTTELGLATSTTGLNWNKYGEKLEIPLGETGAWDEKRILPFDAIYNGEKFLMYYQGWNNASEAFTKVNIGVMESEDGISWVKDSINNPVLMEDHVGVFDEDGIWNVDALYDEDNAVSPYQIWYDGMGTVDYLLYANSDDGRFWDVYEDSLFSWKSEPWSTSWYQDVEVLHVNNKYHMWLTGRNYNAVGGAVGYCVDSSNAVSVIQNTSILYKYSLGQNYPNPFNPSTTIKYSLQTKDKVTLKVFDILGNEVSTLVNEEQEPGFYKVEFNGSSLSTGIYVYRITTHNFTSSKKMMVLK